MSIIVEQPLPIAILLLSRVSTYAHCVESIATTFIFWVYPSLRPGMPASRQVLKKQRIILCRTISIHTLDSSSTLVEDITGTQDNADSSDQTHDPTSKRQKLGSALVKFSSPIMAPTHSIKPFARRLSLPARRLSESFATAVATPFRTHLFDVEARSYFTHPSVTSESSPLYPEDHISQDVDAVQTETEIVFEEVVCVVEPQKSSYQAIKKVTKIKRVTRKMKSLLHFRQRSNALHSS